MLMLMIFYVWTILSCLSLSNFLLENRPISLDYDSISWIGSLPNIRKPLISVEAQEKFYLEDVITETKTLASFLPDEIIFNINSCEPRTIQTAVLFGDLSGFTDLCEKYSVQVGGFSRLTEVLNAYIGAMVQEIMSHGGDILKFSGDAFVVIWQRSNILSLRDAVHTAIDCGIIIQKTYGSFQTDVDVKIKTKLIVTAGKLTLSIIGNEMNSYTYLETGEPIWDLKLAEAFCHVDNLIVSPYAWQFITATEYSFEKCSDELHIKILGIGANWRMVSLQQQQTSEDYNENEFLIRPTINYAVQNNMKDNLKRFILKPVIDAIDLHEPLEYLTEVRHVTVLMFNLIIEPDLMPQHFLELGNEIYKIVCSAVSSFNGVVNKINFFDKDLMILVIFGLRGFKMDFESEISLNCAIQCRESILRITKIQGVSVGVCTGKTYCGVFGHVLRKEYTVISIIVNKAARLMMAYPNKVTCDRSVFISSLLHSKHFILQEYQPLKGINNPGPIYEYKPIQSTRHLEKTVNKFPLLGRDEEIETYKRLIIKAENHFNRKSSIKDNVEMEESQNLLMIEMNRLYGDSRFMEELMFVTPNSIPQIKINLLAGDRLTPFQTIRLIFLTLLGFTDQTSHAKVEKKLKQQLPECDRLHELNDIFMTNFARKNVRSPIHKEYEKQVYITKILKILAYKCVAVLWVINIYNIQYIDTHSWSLINTLLSTNLFFFICGKRSNFSFFDNWSTNKMIYIKMKPLEDIYFCALACQIMEVDGMSPELEKLLQCQSEGRPIWIKNLLITMIQSSEILIETMSYKEAFNMGVLMPPEYLLKRMNLRDKEKLVATHETLTTEDRYLEWPIFKDCIRHDYCEMSMRERYENYFNNERIISVAKIDPKFGLQPLNIEGSVDAWMIRTFDSLTPYQKLLLKCSSTLSTTFPREMLMFVMASDDDRNTAIAIKILFEKNVLVCAHGDFLEGNNTLLFSGRLVDPSTVDSVICNCRGTIIQEGNFNLPRYASCGYLCFKRVAFKNIVYGLLTEKQKQDFHSRAIKYLIKETRKCKSCGNTYMTGIMEKKKMWQFPLRKPGGRSGETRREAVINEEITEFVDGSLSHNSSLTGSVKHQYTISSGEPSVKYSRDERSKHIDVGLFLIYKSKKNNKLLKTYSNLDFSQCKCYSILLSVYAELIDHYKGVGKKTIDKLLEAMLIYSKINIEYYNPLAAKQILADALDIVKSAVYREQYLDWMLDLKKGEIYTLLAHALVHLEQLNDANKIYNVALKYFGCGLPTSNAGIKWKMFFEYFKIRTRYFIYTRNQQRPSVDDEFHNDLAYCLLLYSRMLCDIGNFKRAELAANWSLNNALRSGNNFVLLCSAYAQMITINIKLGNKTLSATLEVYALRMCRMKESLEDFDEAEALKILYRAIFLRRLCRSNLEASLEIGRLAWRIGTIKCASVRIINFLSLFMINNIYRKLFDEAIGVLQEMEFQANEDIDLKGKLTFFYLCVVLQLETCFTVESFKRCEDYLYSEGFIITTRDKTAVDRLSVVMWLWCVRNENWEQAGVWRRKAYALQIKNQPEQISTLLCALYLLEAQILYLVRKIDRRNTKIIFELFERIENLIKKLQQFKSIAPIIAPRLTHLKAYYKLVKYNDYSCLNDLKTAKKLALKYNNLLEYDWITHTEKAWTNQLSHHEIIFWRDHAESHLLDVQGRDFDEKLGFFTLPVPTYM